VQEAELLIEALLAGRRGEVNLLHRQPAQKFAHHLPADSGPLEPGIDRDVQNRGIKHTVGCRPRGTDQLPIQPRKTAEITVGKGTFDRGGRPHGERCTGVNIGKDIPVGAFASERYLRVGALVKLPIPSVVC
jgi:hypothetical protein